MTDPRATTLTAPPDETPPDSQWELWEVFTQEAQGAPHEHAVHPQPKNKSDQGENDDRNKVCSPFSPSGITNEHRLT